MSTEPTSPRTRRGHPHVRRSFLAVTATLSALMMLVGGTAMGAYFWTQSQIRTIGDARPQTTSGAEGGAIPTPDFTGKCARTSCNYLLLGSDSRSGLTPEQQVQFGTDQDIGGSNRSDTIMLVHTEPERKKAVFVSFPRDLWVDIPGVGEDRINAAFEGGINGGGAQLVARTIRQLTGIQIDHILYVDLAGFEGLVDSLGGVDMCVPYPMVDPLTALDIPAGCQHFDGKTALAYVRTRHQPCDAIPDFARITRQQQFLRAVLAKMLAPSELLRIPSLVPALLRNLVVDQGLKNPAELAYLAGQLNGVNTGAADFRVVPTVTGWEGDRSVVHLVQPQGNELFARIRNDRPLGDLGLAQERTAPSPAVVTTVVYGRGPHAAASPSATAPPSASPEPPPSGSASSAADTVFDTLTKGGFDMSVSPSPLPVPDTLPAEVKGSAILYDPTSPQGREMADVLAGYLSNMRVVSVAGSVLPPGVDVAVVVAPTYELPPPSTAPPTDCTPA